MEIGFDFDGVIIDCGYLKTEAARIICGIKIPQEKFKRELVIGEGIMTDEQYTQLLLKIYGSREIATLIKPVRDSLEYLSQLRDDGHKLKVVTSRHNEQLTIAKEWLERNNHEIPLIGIGNNTPKTEACRGLDVFIDDDLDKLEPLIGVVSSLYLFNWGYNEHLNEEGIAKRVNSWREFYGEIKLISRQAF